MGKNPGYGDGAPSLMVLGCSQPGKRGKIHPGSAQLPQPHPCCEGLGLAWGDQSLVSGKQEQGKIPAVAAEPRRSWWLCVGGGAAGSCQAGLGGQDPRSGAEVLDPGRRGAPGPAGKFLLQLKEGAVGGCISWQGAGGWRDPQKRLICVQGKAPEQCWAKRSDSSS